MGGKKINRLKLVLVEKKRTGVWLAQELGVSPVTISKWCSNITQPSLLTLSRIADLLEIDPRVLLNGKDITRIKEKEISQFRRKNLGFVFQDFNLLDTFSIKDNIFLPLVLSKESYPVMKQKLKVLAPKLGIQELLEKYPYEISGGQKQRVAVARALITHPQIVLADEPTGALDSKSTDQLLDIFDQINEEGQTIVMVTHSTKAASYAKRVLFIRDGQVFHQIYRGNQTNEQMYQSISDTLTLLATGGK